MKRLSVEQCNSLAPITTADILDLLDFVEQKKLSRLQRTAS